MNRLIVHIAIPALIGVAVRLSGASHPVQVSVCLAVIWELALLAIARRPGM